MLAHELSKNQDIMVHVICPKMNSYQKSQFLPINPTGFSLIEFSSLKSDYKRFNYLPKIVARVLRLAVKISKWVSSGLYGFDYTLGVSNRLKSRWYSEAEKKLLPLIDDHIKTILVSSSSPFISHVVSSALSSKYGLKWIADYRDPWSTNHVKAQENLSLALQFESQILNRAAGVTVSSNQLVCDIQEIFQGPIRIVHNGYYDQAIRPIPHKNTGIIEILYLGQVYSNFQNLHSFLEAAANINRVNTKINLTFIGNSGVQVKEFFSSRNMRVPRHIRIYPEVPVWKVPGLLQEADVLLFLTWNKELRRSDEYIPTVVGSKIYDYLGAARPILAYGPNCDGAIDSLLLDTHLGVRVENEAEFVQLLDDPNSILYGLHEPDFEVLRRYSFSYQSLRLLEFILSLNSH